jgi:hypothetical protein
MKKEKSEADILNDIERRAKKGKVSDRELRLLVEAYHMHHILIPKEIMKLFGKQNV